jgi:hypothetical protein
MDCKYSQDRRDNQCIQNFRRANLLEIKDEIMGKRLRYIFGK